MRWLPGSGTRVRGLFAYLTVPLAISDESVFCASFLEYLRYNSIMETKRRFTAESLKAHAEAVKATRAQRSTSQCSRCSGTGRIPCYNHISGGICFKCGGRG